MGLLWGSVLVVLFISGGLSVLLNLPILLLRRYVAKLILSLSWWLSIAFVALGLAFTEAIRGIYKYSGLISELDIATDQNAAQMLVSKNYQLQLFRAERNAYLSSFAIVMLIVCYRFAVIVRENIRYSERREHSD